MGAAFTVLGPRVIFWRRLAFGVVISDILSLQYAAFSTSGFDGQPRVSFVLDRYHAKFLHDRKINTHWCLERWIMEERVLLFRRQKSNQQCT